MQSHVKKTSVLERSVSFEVPLIHQILSFNEHLPLSLLDQILGDFFRDGMLTVLPSVYLEQVHKVTTVVRF